MIENYYVPCTVTAVHLLEFVFILWCLTLCATLAHKIVSIHHDDEDDDNDDVAVVSPLSMILISMLHTLKHQLALYSITVKHIYRFKQFTWFPIVITIASHTIPYHPIHFPILHLIYVNVLTIFTFVFVTFCHLRFFIVGEFVSNKVLIENNNKKAENGKLYVFFFFRPMESKSKEMWRQLCTLFQHEFFFFLSFSLLKIRDL